MCGGSNRLSVYSNNLYRAAAAVVPRVGNYVSQGCYSEGTSGRVLSSASYVDANNMMAEKCVGFCDAKGFKLAGVEWPRECYCAISVGKWSLQYALYGEFV